VGGRVQARDGGVDVITEDDDRASLGIKAPESTVEEFAVIHDRCEVGCLPYGCSVNRTERLRGRTGPSLDASLTPP
jgi:hypothetical protein